jgi:Nuclease A inhibitor-like protein
MKPETEKLLANLETIIEPLDPGSYGIGSEGSEVFKTLSRSLAEQGEFDFAKLMFSSNLVKRVELDELVRGWQVTNQDEQNSPEILSKCESILNLCRSHLTNIEAYQFSNYGDEVGDVAADGYTGYELFYFLIGQTKDGDWIGISPLFSEADSCEYGENHTISDRSPSTAAQSFVENLKPILKDFQPGIILHTPKASKGIISEIAGDRECLIEKILESSHMLKTYHFRGFCEEKEVSRIEKEGREYSFQELDGFFKNNLEDSRIYVLGNWADFRLYLIGKTQAGDWLGISTLATWT